MGYGFNIKSARKKAKISQEQLAGRIGISRGAIANYEKENNPPTYENIRNIAAALNVTEQDLFDNASEQRVKITKDEITRRLYMYENLIPSRYATPLIGDASCKVPDEYYYENIEKQIIIPEELWSERVYCIRAMGDSMLPRITPGTICVVDPDAPIDNNDTVHFNWSSESGIRKWSLSEDGKNLTFLPTNISIKNLPLVVNLPTEEILRCAKVIKIITDP